MNFRKNIISLNNGLDGLNKSKISIMENLGKATLIILTVVSMVLVSFLSTYVILQIAEMYNLKFITQFSFIQVYGIGFIFVMVNYKNDKKNSKKEKLSFKESIYKIYRQIGEKLISVLIGWGLAWLMFQILS